MRVSLLGVLLDLAAVALFGVYLVAAVPLAIRRAVNMLRTEAQVAAGESLAGARARCFGDSYIRAIDEIRRALPAERGYLLVDGGGRPQDGDAYWVRYDLAPRPAVFAGQLELLDAASLRRAIAGGDRRGLRDWSDLRQVVVAYAPGVPPRLYDLASFLGDLARRPGAAPIPDQQGTPRPPTPGAAAGHGP